MLDAGGHRRRLAVVAAELDDAQAASRCARSRVAIATVSIAAAVVDEHHLERAAELAERLHDGGVQRPDAFLFVIQRHDDRQTRRTPAAMALLIGRRTRSLCDVSSVVVTFAPLILRFPTLLQHRSHRPCALQRAGRTSSHSAHGRSCHLKALRCTPPCSRDMLDRWHVTCKGQANIRTIDR